MFFTSNTFLCNAIGRANYPVMDMRGLTQNRRKVYTISYIKGTFGKKYTQYFGTDVTTNKCASTYSLFCLGKSQIIFLTP